MKKTSQMSSVWPTVQLQLRPKSILLKVLELRWPFRIVPNFEKGVGLCIPTSIQGYTWGPPIANDWLTGLYWRAISSEEISWESITANLPSIWGIGAWVKRDPGRARGIHYTWHRPGMMTLMMVMVMMMMITKAFWCGRLCSQYFIHTNSFNPYDIPVQRVLLFIFWSKETEAQKDLVTGARSFSH